MVGKAGEIIDHIEAAGMDTLADWEVSFCESISDQLVNEGWVTEAQIERLESIWHDHFDIP